MLYSTLVAASLLSTAMAAQLLPANVLLVAITKRDGACGSASGTCCGTSPYGAMTAVWTCQGDTTCVPKDSGAYSCCPKGASCGTEIMQCSNNNGGCGSLTCANTGNTPACMDSSQTSQIQSMVTAASSVSSVASAAVSSAASAVASVQSSVSAEISSAVSSAASAVSSAVSSATSEAASAASYASSSAEASSTSAEASSSSAASSASSTETSAAAAGSGSSTSSGTQPSITQQAVSGGSRLAFGTSALAVALLTAAYIL